MMMGSQRREVRVLAMLMKCFCILISVGSENQDPEMGQVHYSGRSYADDC